MRAGATFEQPVRHSTAATDGTRGAAEKPAPAGPPLRSGGWWRVPESPTAAQLRAAERACAAPLPNDLGVPGGKVIANIDTILDDTWRALGSKTPPAVVYILVKGDSWWGHSAVAYTRHGETTVMNIVGGPGKELVNFMPLKEYLFGVDRMRSGNPERGAYNREMELYAVWNWPADKIEAMHQFYTELAQRQKEGRARFTLLWSRVLNLVDRAVSSRHVERGNCARWTWRGLAKAGLGGRSTIWPKRLAVRILENEGRANPDNVDIVYVPWIRHATRTKKFAPETSILVTPLNWVRNLRYLNLAERAGARIVVDPGSTVARVERQSRAWSRV